MRRPGEAESGARRSAFGPGSQARRRRAPGRTRLRPREPPRTAGGHGRVRVRCASALLQLASLQAWCGVPRAVPASAPRHQDRLFLVTEAPRLLRAAAAARRPPLPHARPWLGARGGGAGAFSPLLFATCGGRCMPGEQPGRLQVRATPREGDPPTPARTRGTASRRRESGRQQATKAAAGAGARGRGRRAPSAGGERALGAARAELRP